MHALCMLWSMPKPLISTESDQIMLRVLLLNMCIMNDPQNPMIKMGKLNESLLGVYAKSKLIFQWTVFGVLIFAYNADCPQSTPG